MRNVAFVLALAGIALAGPITRAEGELEGALSAESVESAEAASMPAGSVARSAFTTAILDREPRDSIQTLSNDHRSVFYFTELRDLQGRTITHRWEHDGQPVAEVFFEVRGPRWRVYSSKNLPADALGEWSVAVVDDDNQVLHRDSFVYAEAAEPAAEPPAPGRMEPSAAAQPAQPAEPTPPAAPTDEASPDEPSATPAPGAMQY